MTVDRQRRLDRVTSSMLWAAWADALGFISELTDEQGLKRRLNGRDLDRPVAWQRKVGGRFGAMADLPAGCYSDDTQLRLASARAMGRRGFDVEAFAKIELTIWPSYALGGGRASKAAADNLRRSAVPWFGNFYDGYLKAGGNGAAMRIQPHVWAGSEVDGEGQLLGVLSDAIVTHGHPRALVGAALHAVALEWALRHGTPPPPEAWGEILTRAAASSDAIGASEQLASLWAPAWESAAKLDLSNAWSATTDECGQLFESVLPMVDKLRAADTTECSNLYEALIGELGLSEPATRGSGISTTIAAMAVATAFPHDPAGAARLTASAIGTDTDTIATMAAAIAGASDTAGLPDDVLDSDYLRREAGRLAALSLDERTEDFAYPDLLHWTPPRSQLDAAGLTHGKPALAGLGSWTPADNNVYEAKTGQWRWVQTDFGPSMLLKHRADLPVLPDGNQPRKLSGHESSRRRRVQPPLDFDVPDNGSMSIAVEDRSAANRDARKPDSAPDPRSPSAGASGERVELDQILSWLERKRFDDASVGYAVRRVAELGTSEQMIALTAALRTRMRVH